MIDVFVTWGYIYGVISIYKVFKDFYNILKIFCAVFIRIIIFRRTVVFRFVCFVSCECVFDVICIFCV